MGFGDKDTHPVYKGQVKDGKPNGLGVLNIYFGKSKYIGSWKNGKRHGQGIMYYLDGGGKHEGEYKDGLLWNGIDYDKDGKIRDKIVNGKWNGLQYDKDGNIKYKWVNGKEIKQ